MSHQPGDDRWPDDEVWPGDGWPGGEQWPGVPERGGDRQDATDPTHRIARPLSETAAPGGDRQDEPGEDDQPAGFVDAVWEALDQLRFVSQAPGSLRDQIEYAHDGAYSIRVNGPWRTVNIGYARTIAFVGLGLCYFIAFAFFTRLSRALTFGVVLPCALMLLNAVPVTAWLVPDGLDFTTWWRG